MPKFAETLLPLALPGTYTYRIPDGMTLSIGMRVLVPFGRKKFFTAIVTLLHDREPKGYDVKEILTTLDDKPILRHPQLEFWQWIADYYLCSMGEVYKAAVPSGLKVESETTISANPDFEESEPGQLTDRERVILDFTAQRGRVQIAEIAKATGFKTVERSVSHLLDLDALHVSERVIDNYRPKTESCVRLTAARDDEATLHHWFDQLKRAPKQEALLLAYLDLSRWLQSGEVREVSKDSLLKRSGVSAARCIALDECMIVYNDRENTTLNRSCLVAYKDPTVLHSLSNINPYGYNNDYGIQLDLKKYNTNTIVLMLSERDPGWGSGTGMKHFGYDLGWMINNDTFTTASAVTFEPKSPMSRIVPFANYMIYQFNNDLKTFSMGNFLKHRLVGTTNTATSYDAYKNISNKNWTLTVTNIGGYQGLPPGQQQ